jgi:hypothetical protein
MEMGTRLNTMAPEMCQTGSGLPNTSCSVQAPWARKASVLLVRLSWLSITALGEPVVPDVQNRPATSRSSGSGSRGRIFTRSGLRRWPSISAAGTCGNRSC